MADVLAARDRRMAAPTFSPDGLYFLGPRYAARWGMPDRTPLYDGAQSIMAPQLAASRAARPPEGAQTNWLPPSLPLRVLRGPPRGRNPPWDGPAVDWSLRSLQLLAPASRCGITREQDRDAAVAAGVDALGFVLYAKSPRAVSAERAAELAQGLPPWVTPVLLFVNAPLAEIQAACALVPGAMLQFHGDESAAECEAAASITGRAYLRAARIPSGQASGKQAPAFDLLEYAQIFSHAKALLLDTHAEGYGGSGKVFDWSLLPPNVNAHLVLGGGLHAANVGDGIAQLRPRCNSLAVDVSSGVEASDADGKPLKGIKDPLKIKQFVAAVRTADQHLAGIQNHV